MDELQLVGSHSEPAGVSKEVSRIFVVKQQNSDRSVPLKKNRTITITKPTTLSSPSAVIS